MSLRTYLGYKPYFVVKREADQERNKKLIAFIEGHPEEELLFENILKKERDTNYYIGVLLGILIGIALGIILAGAWLFSALIKAGIITIA